MAPPKTTKPSTPTQSNTLFNYFQRTPKSQQQQQEQEGEGGQGSGEGSSNNNNKPSTPCENQKENATPKTPQEGETRTPKYNGETPKGRPTPDLVAPNPTSTTTPSRKRESTTEGSGTGGRRKNLRESEENKEKEPVKKKNKEEGKRKRQRISSPQLNKKSRKRLRVIESDEEEDGVKDDDGSGGEESDQDSDSDEYVPSGDEEEDEEELVEPPNSAFNDTVSEGIFSSDEEDEVEELSDDEMEKPKKKGAKGAKRSRPSSAKSSSRSRKSSLAVQPRLQAFAKSPSSSNSSSPLISKKKDDINKNGSCEITGKEGDLSGDRTDWSHLKFDFLQPKNIRDKQNRRPDDSKYDPTTVFIPKSFLDKQTPAHTQWWMFKQLNFDSIIFFKMGSFYEFFHMDAVTAVQELGIAYMKGDYAHAGFPEAAYSKFANMLIEKGYKIARVEQTETPQMKDARLKKTKGKGPADKTIKRELCQIATKGIRIATIQDDPGNSPFAPESKYLYAVAEKVMTDGKRIFGVCFVDTTIGEFHMGQFEDDRYFSRLRTLFAHHPPAHVIVQRGNLVCQAEEFVNSYAGLGVRIEFVPLKFQNPGFYITAMREEGYFYDKNLQDTVWPEALKQMLAPGQTEVVDGYDLTMQTLGAVSVYLKNCQVGHDLMTLRRFSIYKPVDTEIDSIGNKHNLPSRMVIDGITLYNLDVIESISGRWNLFSMVDNCNTAFGKRLLREWVCKPLTVPADIAERLDAVEELMNIAVFVNDEVTPRLRSLPDLERLLSKIHTLGSAHRSKHHPDGRASFFADARYSKNKIVDLVAVIKGFKTGATLFEHLSEATLKSKLLVDLYNQFPDLFSTLKQFETSFDQTEALKIGKIIPKKGVEPELDEADKSIQRVHENARKYLEQMKTKLKTSQVAYFGNDKKRFQLEVAEKVRVPSDWVISSTKKGFKRYTNDDTKQLLESLQEAETRKDEILRDVTRRIFEKFDGHYEQWKLAVDCLAKLDALLSLTTYSMSQPSMCRPKVILSDKPFVKIEEGRHPCIPYDACIPNTCYLGVPDMGEMSEGTFLLLTGPNMGGKSTLMRQVALSAILAHVGCFVPAASCKMSVVDRIFTRMGAADNIGDGESTFFVELSEAGAILKHSTRNSLVLMDELGRGTATYDGTAIAYAVGKKLASEGIRTFFSTHYHSLVETMQIITSVQLGHMSCMVESRPNEEEVEDPTQETITFLYRLVPGPCPKSYGFNAALLADLPNDVIRTGHQKAKAFEDNNNNVDVFRKSVSLSGNKLMTLEKAVELLSL